MTIGEMLENCEYTTMVRVYEDNIDDPYALPLYHGYHNMTGPLSHDESLNSRVIVYWKVENDYVVIWVV